MKVGDKVCKVFSHSFLMFGTVTRKYIQAGDLERNDWLYLEVDWELTQKMKIMFKDDAERLKVFLNKPVRVDHVIPLSIDEQQKLKDFLDS
jgi:hypothetical protein